MSASTRMDDEQDDDQAAIEAVRKNAQGNYERFVKALVSVCTNGNPRLVPDA